MYGMKRHHEKIEEKGDFIPELQSILLVDSASKFWLLCDIQGGQTGNYILTVS